MDDYQTQINKLRQSLNMIAKGAGRFAYPSDKEESFLKKFPDILRGNRKESISGAQKQILLSFEFAKHATFYGYDLLNDQSFWNNEIDRDYEWSEWLFGFEENDLYLVVAAGDIDKRVTAAREQREEILTAADRYKARRMIGECLYDPQERPTPPNSIRETLSFLRSHQLNAVILNAETLIERTKIYQQAARLIGDRKTAEGFCASGHQHLTNAEIMINGCAVHYSSYEQRLENKRAPSP